MGGIILGKSPLVGGFVVSALALESGQGLVITNFSLKIVLYRNTKVTSSVLTIVVAAGLKPGARVIPSVLCRFELRTVEEMERVTSPERSRVTLLSSKPAILKVR